MTTVIISEGESPPIPRRPRWLSVVVGVAWLIVALVVLSFDTTSAVTIGWMMAFVLVFAGVDELIAMAVMPSWQWLHAVLGVLFIASGLMALLSPLQTFGILTMLIGWYLLIKGFFDVFTAIGFRDQIPLWGIVLAMGVIEIMVGLWALGYPGRSAWLLIIWVGIGALMRGIGDIVLAFVGGDR